MAHYYKHTIPTVKHGGGSIMMLLSSRPRKAFNSRGWGKKVSKYWEILENTVMHSTRKLLLGRRFVFKKDNDPKHTAEDT